VWCVEQQKQSKATTGRQAVYFLVSNTVCLNYAYNCRNKQEGLPTSELSNLLFICYNTEYVLVHACVRAYNTQHRSSVACQLAGAVVLVPTSLFATLGFHYYASKLIALYN
jgi:hypothetical protein